MPLDFNKHAEKGNQFLKELAHQLGDTDTKNASRVLQAVIRTLRNHLTFEENFQFLSQLPMALKSVYVSGWNPSKQHDRIKNKIEFLEEVTANEGPNFWRQFSDLEDAEVAVLAVLNTMRKYVSEGEFKDIEAVLPAQLKSLVRDSDYH